MDERACFSCWFGVFGGDGHGGGYLVVLVEVDELDALGAAAGGSDLPGVDADDFAGLDRGALDVGEDFFYGEPVEPLVAVADVVAGTRAIEPEEAREAAQA